MSDPNLSYTRTFHTGSAAATAPRGSGWFRFSIRFRAASTGRKGERGEGQTTVRRVQYL